MRKNNEVSTTATSAKEVLTFSDTNVTISSKCFTPEESKRFLDFVWNTLSTASIDALKKHKTTMTPEMFLINLNGKLDPFIRGTFKEVFETFKKSLRYFKPTKFGECYSKETFECLVAVYKVILHQISIAMLDCNGEVRDDIYEYGKIESLFSITEQSDELVPISRGVLRANDNEWFENFALLRCASFFKDVTIVYENEETE